jgi:hypothetical protein
MRWLLVWDHPPTELMLRDEAFTVLRPPYADWLRSLPPECEIADLRAALPGSGFDFDNHKFTRFPNSLVFAVLQNPPRPPGLLKRLVRRLWS